MNQSRGGEDNSETGITVPDRLLGVSMAPTRIRAMLDHCLGIAFNQLITDLRPCTMRDAHTTGVLSTIPGIQAIQLISINNIQLVA